MLDSKDFGKTIANLRKQAGYSQKQLADALNITDKAISKWERGLSCPDISLLPKLSALLDSDIEPLLSGVSTFYTNNWKGVLDLTALKLPVDTIIYDKPMVYYLFSYFMLVEITDIIIICTEKQKLYIESVLNFEQYGLCISYKDYLSQNEIANQNIFYISEPVFIFGPSLTRQLQSFLSSSEQPTRIYQNNNQETSLYFIPKNTIKDETNDFLKDSFMCKKLGRGYICIPLNSYESILDISNFVQFYQKYHNQKIANIEELAKNRNLSKQ